MCEPEVFFELIIDSTSSLKTPENYMMTTQVKTDEYIPSEESLRIREDAERLDELQRKRDQEYVNQFYKANYSDLPTLTAANTKTRK